jgi:hypothetical protein
LSLDENRCSFAEPVLRFRILIWMIARQLPGVMWSTLITVHTALSQRTTCPLRISVA